MNFETANEILQSGGVSVTKVSDAIKSFNIKTDTNICSNCVHYGSCTYSYNSFVIECNHYKEYMRDKRE